MKFTIAFIFLFLLGAFSANAVTFTWTGALGTDWLIAGNWNVGSSVATTYPGQNPSDFAVINAAGGVPFCATDLILGSLKIYGASSAVHKRVIFGSNVTVNGPLDLFYADVLGCPNKTFTANSSSNALSSVRSSKLMMPFTENAKVALFQGNVFECVTNIIYGVHNLTGANQTNGGNTFNGITTITGNIGSPYYPIIYGAVAPAGPDQFVGPLTVNSNSSSVIRLAHATSGNTFSGGVNLNVTTSSYIFLGSGTGYTSDSDVLNVNTISDNVHITGASGVITLGSTTAPKLHHTNGSISRQGAAAFNATLNLSHIEFYTEFDLKLIPQPGLDPNFSFYNGYHTISVGKKCIFNEKATLDGSDIYLNGGTFKKDAVVIKRGSHSLYYAGGNTYKMDMYFTTTTPNEFVINFLDGTNAQRESNIYEGKFFLTRIDQGTNSKFILNNSNDPLITTRIEGDFICTVGANNFVPITIPIVTNYLEFGGGANQLVKMSGMSVSKDLKIDKSGGLVKFINNNTMYTYMGVGLFGELKFSTGNTGKIFMEGESRFGFAGTATCTTSNSSSFIIGRMHKQFGMSSGATVDAFFKFPCGSLNSSNDPIYAPIEVTIPYQELVEYSTYGNVMHVTAQHYSPTSDVNYCYWYVRPFLSSYSWVNHEEHYTSMTPLTPVLTRNFDMKVKFNTASTLCQTGLTSLERGMYTSSTGTSWGTWGILPSGTTPWNAFVTGITDLSVQFDCNASENYSHYRFNNGSLRLGEFAENSDESETESTNTTEFEISPNPANESFAITNASYNSGKSEIRVFDAAGKLVLQKTAAGFPFIINTGDISSGIYFLTIENDAGVTRKKVVVSHDKQ